MNSMTRRTFLKSTAAASLLTALPALADAPDAAPAHEWPENGTLIPDEGWHLWVDQQAEWKDDRIYLLLGGCAAGESRAISRRCR